MSMGGWFEIWIGEEDEGWSELQGWCCVGSDCETDIVGSDSVTGTDSVATVSITDSGMVCSGVLVYWVGLKEDFCF